jgi:hypothetical protein
MNTLGCKSQNDNTRGTGGDVLVKVFGVLSADNRGVAIFAKACFEGFLSKQAAKT